MNINQVSAWMIIAGDGSPLGIQARRPVVAQRATRH